MNKIAICLISTILLFPAISAQENKNLQDTFLEAEYFLLNEDYTDALGFYLQLHEKLPENANITYKTGVCYLNIPEKEPFCSSSRAGNKKHVSQT